MFQSPNIVELKTAHVTNQKYPSYVGHFYSITSPQMAAVWATNHSELSRRNLDWQTGDVTKHLHITPHPPKPF